MPMTDIPNVGTNIVWPTGTNETSGVLSSGQTKRVSADDLITARDINSIRSVMEAMLVHSHEYTDNVGSRGGC